MSRLGLLLVLACCGGNEASYRTTPAAATSRLSAGCAAGMLSIDGVSYAFARDAVSIIQGGKVASRVVVPGSAEKPSTWTAATSIHAPSGGHWAVGLAGGRLWRVTSAGELEEITGRLGIADTEVLAIDAAGATLAIGLADGVAISRDPAHMMKFPGAPASVIAASRDRVAIARASVVEVFDLAQSTRITYPVKDVTSLAFLDPETATARLVVRTRSAIYVGENGLLRRKTLPARARELVVAGPRLWVITDAGLFSVEGNAPLRAALDVQPGDQLCSSPEGVWLARRDTAELVSFDPARSAASGAVATITPWEGIVAPLFQRVCSGCHLPGGEADLDLSTAATWRENADLIEEVLVTGAMPPPGTDLRSADREALLGFLRR
ncbi:MAG: hypothetical protein JWP01_3239 [Myxococcales bacterium]|nr:hypothetical protein [Myxococcales bacterium]